jgi:uncharacterized protein involved in exopolysaccharide biosynthesis
MECGNILDFISFITTITALLFAWYTYNKDKKAKVIQMLAKEVIAFYCIEQEAIKMLKEKDPGKTEQAIQRELRAKAQNNENNIENLRPTMSATGARKFL